MSQASKRHAQRLVRERKRVARFISEVSIGPDIFCGACTGSGVDYDCECDCPREPIGNTGDSTVYHHDDCEAWHCLFCSATGSGREVKRKALLAGGEPFDVHVVREAATTLLLMETEQDAFEDWCRQRGRGPENREPGAFARRTSLKVAYMNTRRTGKAEHVRKMTARGGWPGNLAREWPGDSRAPMGRRLAKLGRAVLRALEGQPSACTQHLSSAWADASLSIQWRGSPVTISPDMFAPPGWSPTPSLRDRFVLRGDRWFLPGRVRGRCPNCRGSGHSLRGELPPLACNPQLLRRMTETEGGYFDEDMAPWLVALGRVEMDPPITGFKGSGQAISGVEALELMGPLGVDDRTRVVRRGHHRADVDIWPTSEILACTLDQRITARGWSTLAGTGRATADEVRELLGRKKGLRPRWRRGELAHAKQRRPTGLLGLSPGNITAMADEQSANRPGPGGRVKSRRPSAVVHSVFAGGISVSCTVADEADDLDPDASMAAALALTNR